LDLGFNSPFIAKNISQSHYHSAIFDLKDLNPLIELNIIEKQINNSQITAKAIFLQASENNIINRSNYNKILEKIKEHLNIDQIRIAMYGNFIKDKKDNIEFLAKQLINKDHNLANICLLSQILSYLDINKTSPDLQKSVFEYYKQYFSKQDLSYKEIEFALITNQQYIKFFFNKSEYRNTENDLLKIINISGEEKEECKRNLPNLLIELEIADPSILNLETIDGAESYLKYLKQRQEALINSLGQKNGEINNIAQSKIEQEREKIEGDLDKTKKQIVELSEKLRPKMDEEGNNYIKTLENLKYCNPNEDGIIDHNIKELNKILERNLLFGATKNLVNKSIEGLRGYFKDDVLMTYFSRLKLIDKALTELNAGFLDGEVLDEKIKELFPKIDATKMNSQDLDCLSSNYLFFKQMNVYYANKLYQEIKNLNTENQELCDILKIEYLSYLISNNLIFDNKYQNDINEIFTILDKDSENINISSESRSIKDIFVRKIIEQMPYLKDPITIPSNWIKIIAPLLEKEDVKNIIKMISLTELFYLYDNAKKEGVGSKIFEAIKEIIINDNGQFYNKLYCIWFKTSLKDIF
jgi:hypothetical protein